MIEICAIASGSNGNCYYVGNGDEAVLVDVGLSARQIQLRMDHTGIDCEKIKAILITHEHSDHCKGARVLGRRLRVPVYITKKTYLAMPSKDRPTDPEWFEPGNSFLTGGITVFPFSKKHDAAEATSFRICCGGVNIGVMTDIGIACDGVKAHFALCEAVFLETNYDTSMLWNGSYPYHLKQRISSDSGHLSNDQAGELVRMNAGRDLKMIILSHLSAENNTPEKAFEAFMELRDSYQIKITSRAAPTEIFVL